MRPPDPLYWLEAADWLEQPLLGSAVWRWLVAAVLLVVLLPIFVLIVRFITGRLERFVASTENRWDDGPVKILQRTQTWFLLALALYAATLVLALDENARAVARSFIIIASLLQGALWGNVALQFALTRYVKSRAADDAAAATTVSAVRFLGQLILWSLVLLLALDNIGVDVTALVAGLGIGGIAVALAAQNILGDLFASLSIVLDKPFVLGDFIVVGEMMGTVEKIGLKTTRLRSLSGEQLVFSNTDLLGSRVRNFKRMIERRVVFTIGVIYETPYEKLTAIPAIIREVIESRPDARFDRSHFKGYGDFSLLFETVYYVLSPDFNLHMDIQQAVNLGIFRRFEESGIVFAYPTQTLLLQRANSTSQ